MVRLLDPCGDVFSKVRGYNGVFLLSLEKQMFLLRIIKTRKKGEIYGG
jgi:hypothetical protein